MLIYGRNCTYFKHYAFYIVVHSGIYFLKRHVKVDVLNVLCDKEDLLVRPIDMTSTIMIK